jgi:hypothetical protein
MIFKNLVLQALGTIRIRFRFLQKSNKNISCLCTFKNLSILSEDDHEKKPEAKNLVTLKSATSTPLQLVENKIILKLNFFL